MVEILSLPALRDYGCVFAQQVMIDGGDDGLS